MNKHILNLPSITKWEVISSQVDKVVPPDALTDPAQMDRTNMSIHIAYCIYGMSWDEIAFQFEGRESTVIPLLKQADDLVHTSLERGHLQTLYRHRAALFFLNTWRP